MSLRNIIFEVKNIPLVVCQENKPEFCLSGHKRGSSPVRYTVLRGCASNQLPMSLLRVSRPGFPPSLKGTYGNSRKAGWPVYPVITCNRMIRHKVAAGILITSSEADAGKDSYTGEQVHGSEQICNICHGSHRMEGMGLVKKTDTELCLECHPDRMGSSEHVVDVIPSMQDVGGLPLAEGKMTCVTCHDSHKNTIRKMLRIPPGELCKSCHKQ